MRGKKVGFLLILLLLISSIFFLSAPTINSKVMYEQRASNLVLEPFHLNKPIHHESNDFYFTKAKYPVSLSLNGKNVPIKTVHTDSKGRMEVIDDPGILGWYDTKGYHVQNILLSGHRDWNGKAGVLYGMEDWKEIQLTLHFNDKTKEIFSLEKVMVYPKRNVPKDVMSLSGTRPHVTFITCVGDFIRSKGGYQSRVVATFIPKSKPSS